MSFKWYQKLKAKFKKDPKTHRVYMWDLEVGEPLVFELTSEQYIQFLRRKDVDGLEFLHTLEIE